MKIIGHRGARNEAPENTIEGFVHAYENGCRDFELDIQLSADHQLVVYHDKNLKRTSGLSNKVKHSTSGFLNRTDARLNTPGWHSPCFIPKLVDLVNILPDVESWQFEIKSGERHAQKRIIKLLFGLISAKKLEKRATITSSHKWLLWETKRLHPHLKTGYVAEWRYNQPVKTATHLGCEMLILNHRLASPSLIKRAHAKNLLVSCWTVNDLGRASQLSKLSIDSIITDEPTRFLETLMI